LSTLRLHRWGARGHGAGWPVLLAAVTAGVLLGGLAVGYQVRQKTTTEFAIAGVIVALACVVVGRPRHFLLAIIAFDLPLQWGKYLHWDTALANVGEIPGFQLSLTTLALAGLYALWAFNRRGGAARRIRLRAALPLIIYVAVSGASLLVAKSKSLGVYQLEMLTQTLLLFVYVASTVRTRSEIRFLIGALLTGALLESVLIVAMSTTGLSPSFLGLKNHVDVQEFGRRIGGTFGSPNGAAAYLCLMLPLAMGVLASSERGRLRLLAGACLPIGVVALLITESRGGWISFVISTAIMVVWAVRRHLIPARTTAVAAIGAIAVLIGFWGPIHHRLTGNDNGAAGSRFSLAREAEHVIAANPVLGVGLNNYGIVLPSYVGPQFAGQWVYTVHNKYLLVWAEAGIGALAAFLWFLLATVRRGWRCARRGDELFSPVAMGLTAGVVGQLVHMGVDIFQDRPQVEGLWLVAALLVSIEAVVRLERRGSPSRGRTTRTWVVPARHLARRSPLSQNAP
jgi:O-antigen ligase